MQAYLGRGRELRQEFLSAEPFPLVVLDDFLDPALAAGLVEEFPSLAAMPRSRDYIFGRKHELSSVEASGDAGARFVRAVLSDEFRRFLSELSGFDVFVDPSFHGGGFHQGGDGSFLDMHVDFNVHPEHPGWMRTLNILVYLNPDWRSEYGGELLVKSRIDEEPRAVAPLYNRAVIMLTDDRTFHGYRRMTLPPGVTRRSVASYAYRLVDETVVARTTGWAPENAGVAKRMVSRNYDRAVRVKNRLFGSGTAKNR